MVTPEEIRKKALAKYSSFLKYEFISKEEEFFPLVIRCEKSIDLKELEKGMTSLFLASKKNKGYGYDYDDKKRNTKLLGEQNLPTRIFFPTERDFLDLIQIYFTPF